MSPRSWPRVLALAAALLLAPAAATAAAAPAEEADPFARRWSLAALGGLGTPVGMVGAEAEVTLHPSWLLSAGGGAGVTGPQVAAMPRFRTTWGHSAAVFGAGLSYGHFATVGCTYTSDCLKRQGRVLWANLQAAVEMRSAGGFLFRVFGGLGTPINRSALSCMDNPRAGCDEYPTLLPFLGLGLGRAF